MAQEEVSVEIRLAAAVARKLAGGKINVAGTCRELGISRQTFYVYERRYAELGIGGVLEPLSRRPRRSPTQTSAAVEEVIVRLRKQLADDGWDNGALSIASKLPAAMQADPTLTGVPVPSRSTIHRVLRRRGQVLDEPAKRPRSADVHRFEYDRPNACWQVDATDWELADGTVVVIVQVLDDHSRKLLAHHVAGGETAQAVWAALTTAIGRHGLPAQVLTDRGSAMLGRPDIATIVKTRLRALGVRCVSSRGHHPQTCGKNERVHQTLHRWLRARPAAHDLDQLQALVDTFELPYNTGRAHQALAGDTPHQRYTASDKATPADGGQPQQAPLRIAHNTVNGRGIVNLAGRWQAHLGRQWEGCTITVLRQDLHVSLFYGDRHLLDLTIDPDRIYQSTGQTNTTNRGRRRPRIKDTGLSAMS